MNKKMLVICLSFCMIMTTIVTSATSFQTEKNKQNNHSQNILQPLVENWLYYDDGTNYDAVGRSGGGSFEWGIRLTPKELTPYNGKEITVIRHHHGSTNSNSFTTSGEVRIYTEGTDTQPGTLLTSEAYTVTDIGWFDVHLTNGVTIDANNDLWVTVTTTHKAGQYPAGVDQGPIVRGKGGLITMDGTRWWELTEFNIDMNWNLRAGINESFIINNLTGGIGTSADIKNTNSNIMTDIQWNITINGGLFNLLNKTYHGTITAMTPEEIVTINSDVFFGFGPLTITVSVSSQGGLLTKKATGTCIGPFIFLSSSHTKIETKNDRPKMVR